MTWKEDIWKELLRYRREEGTDRLTLRELNDHAEGRLSDKHPRNDHVRAKIRQVLQQLRDDGDVKFIDEGGTYEIVSSDDSSNETDDLLSEINTLLSTSVPEEDSSQPSDDAVSGADDPDPTYESLTQDAVAETQFDESI